MKRATEKSDATRYAVYYPTLHEWDYMSFVNKDRAVLRADRRATCFSVHKVVLHRPERVSHADAEYLRCPRLDGECAKSCYYRKWKTYGGGKHEPQKR